MDELARNGSAHQNSNPNLPATMAEVYCFCFKRTRHASHPLPHKKHSRRYPHHYQHQHPPKSSACYYTTSSNLSKFLILLFLSICDNRASRTHVAAAEVYSSSGSQLTSSSSSSSFSNVVYRDDSQVESASAAASGTAAVNRTRLQEIVMEGLGLSAIPDVRAMNVSQQEYETKYREYLERVNRRSSGQLELPRSQRRPRRQALRQQDDETDGEFEEEEIEEDQEDIVEDEDDSSQHSKLNHQNLRRKRSVKNDYDLVYIRFDIPTRNSSSTGGGDLPALNSPSFFHDPTSNGNQQHPQHHHRHHQQTLSNLPPISPENIEESSLNIMLTRSPNSERSTSAGKTTPTTSPPHHGRRRGRVKFKHNNQQHNGHHGKNVHLFVYQLVEPYQRHLLTSRTIAVEDLADGDKKWFQLPLDEAVRTWLDGSRKNLGLEIYCENCYNNDIFVIHDSSPFFAGYDETPVLNVVGKLVQREKRSKAGVQRYRPTMRDYMTPPKTATCTPNNKRCCRHPLLVDFRDIEGFEFIIQPKIFDAGFCRGRCPYKYNPGSHHALIQSLLHEHVKYDVPKPCCAPVRLDHIDVLHADPKNPQRLKVTTWVGMRVTECACS
ncbi:hypothetical protein quinque_007382 [Culex quinquefasciatus]